MKYRAQENTKKSRWTRGCLCLLSVVCCLVDVSAMGRSLVQTGPTDCVVSLSVIWKFQEWGGPGPHWAVAPEKKKTCVFKSNTIRWLKYICVRKKRGRKKGSDSSANIGVCLNWRMHLTGPRYWARYRWTVTALNSTCVIWSGECNSTCPNGRRLLRYDR